MSQGLTSWRFPYVPLPLSVRQRNERIEALLDTGFDGDVAMPPEFVAGEPPDGYLPWTLADCAGEEEVRWLPRDRLNGGPGTPETLNWVASAGAMEAEPMTLVDYVPCCRSAAGTGHRVTFAYWKQGSARR